MLLQSSNLWSRIFTYPAFCELLHAHTVKKLVFRIPLTLCLYNKGGFTQNPVTAYDPAYGQRQSSHRLRWPYPAEFSRFRPASGLLKIVLNKPDCRDCW